MFTYFKGQYTNLHRYTHSITHDGHEGADEEDAELRETAGVEGVALLLAR